MRKAIYCFAALVLFSISACVEEENYLNKNIAGEIQTVRVLGPEAIEFEPITGNAPTKGTIVDNGTTLKFNWVVGDTLGIFPNKGNQVEFPISSTDGSTSASFDGGGWALRNNSSYAAYYPFSVWNYHRDNETILLDYSGQVQDGNGSFSHLSAYDYLASVKTTPMNSSVTFNMERQGSILYIDIVVPEAETIRELVVSCDDEIFVEKASLDISGESPVVTPVKMSSKLTLSFENTATTEADETVRAYMAVHPLDFSDKVVTATLVTESGSYTAPVTSRIVNKGKAAFLRFSDAFTPVNIEFADTEVKRICVENWDTDGDGELSYKEAAAVTDLGTVFEENNTITTFEELQYFTGLTEIGDNAFLLCTGLHSIVFPENITEIGEEILLGSSIKSIVIPKKVERIYGSSFATPALLEEILVDKDNKHYWSEEGVLFNKSMTELVCYPRSKTSLFYSIPEGVNIIGSFAFFGTYKLTGVSFPESLEKIDVSAFEMAGVVELDLPSNLKEIGSGAFQNCHSLTIIHIPAFVSKIGNNVFSGCDNLTKIIVNIQTPFAIDYEVFDNTNNCPIYVPNESVEAYKTTQGWSDYADRIFPIDVENSVVGSGTENPEE